MTTTIDPPLFDVAIVTPDYEPELTLPQRYAAWIAVNGHVLDAFERLTEEWLDAGHQRVGMKHIAETARWMTGVRSSDGEWKINNSYVSFLSRDILARRPEWAQRIHLREQKSLAGAA